MSKRGCEVGLATAQSKATLDGVGQVHNRFAAANAVALIVVGLAACASPDTGASRKAAININGNPVINTDRVRCTQVEWLRTIEIGDNAFGGRLVVDEAGPTPTAKSVHIQNLGGFNGMYSEGDGGSANLSLSGESFRVTRVAEGFNAASKQPASATFEMSVRC